MENSGASDSGPVEQDPGYDAFMDVDQQSNSSPRVGPDPFVGFDQAFNSLLNRQPLVQPDASQELTRFNQAGNPIPNGPDLGEEPATNLDPSPDTGFNLNNLLDPTMDLANVDVSNMDFSDMDLSNLDFSTVDFSHLIPLSPSPPPANPNGTTTNGPLDFPFLVPAATSEPEIIALHAHLPREYHLLAQTIDARLHDILALVNAALAAPDTIPNPAAETASCLAQLPQLMQACQALQADGATLCEADRGGYGVLCRTFHLVAYRFDAYSLWPEVGENWFEAFLGLRERIGRMGRDGLFVVAREVGAQVLGGGVEGEEVEEMNEGVRVKDEDMEDDEEDVEEVEEEEEDEVQETKLRRSKRLGRGQGDGGKAKEMKWERDGNGRLIKR